MAGTSKGNSGYSMFTSGVDKQLLWTRLPQEETRFAEPGWAESTVLYPGKMLRKAG